MKSKYSKLDKAYFIYIFNQFILIPHKYKKITKMSIDFNFLTNMNVFRF